jgi:hypothetical protein
MPETTTTTNKQNHMGISAKAKEKLAPLVEACQEE